MTQINGRTLQSVEVIWDRDHATSNEGWYLRTSWQDGPYSVTEDEVIDSIQDLPRDTDDAKLRSAAVLYLHDPDGMTDADREQLRHMVEIIR